MDTIKLRKPLLVNGKELAELPYDFDKVGSDGFGRAENRAKKGRAQAGMTVELFENDYNFCLQLGFEGIMAAEPSIDIADLERMTGADVARVMSIGRFFILGSAVEPEDSPEKGSDEPSESTPTSSASPRTK